MGKSLKRRHLRCGVHLGYCSLLNARFGGQFRDPAPLTESYFARQLPGHAWVMMARKEKWINESRMRRSNGERRDERDERRDDRQQQS